MKKALILVIAALAIPSVALAAKPTHGTKTPPKMETYVLKGALSNYTAYNAQTSTNGSITILVSKANAHGKALKGQTLTFPVDANTMVSLKNGVTAITNGDRGIVKVRAAKKIPAADLAATLQASSAKQVVDQGAAKPAHGTKIPPKMETYVLKGTLSNYSAYDSSTPANGSITILVSKANAHGKALKGQTLTFPVDANTKVSLENGVTAIANGDNGIVKVRAAKRIPAADLAATLQASSARQIVDQGASS